MDELLMLPRGCREEGHQYEGGYIDPLDLLGWDPRADETAAPHEERRQMSDSA
jgi:hypothetical protein